jgi:hypothetical protein
VCKSRYIAVERCNDISFQIEYKFPGVGNGSPLVENRMMLIPQN